MKVGVFLTRLGQMVVVLLCLAGKPQHVLAQYLQAADYVTQCAAQQNAAYCDSALQALKGSEVNQDYHFLAGSAYYHKFLIEQKSVFVDAQASMGTQFFTPRRAYQGLEDNHAHRMRTHAKEAIKHLSKVRRKKSAKPMIHELEAELESMD